MGAARTFPVGSAGVVCGGPAGKRDSQRTMQPSRARRVPGRSRASLWRGLVSAGWERIVWCRSHLRMGPSLRMVRIGIRTYRTAHGGREGISSQALSRRPIDTNSRDADASRRGIDASRRGIGANRRGTDANSRGTDANRRDTDANSRGTDANRRGIDANRRPIDANRRPIDANRRFIDRGERRGCVREPHV